MDNIPGKKYIEKIEQTGNEVTVPPTGRRLGLVEFAKRTVKEIGEDHLAAFAGNLTYKGLFALFPFFVFMLSLLGLFGAPDLLDNLLEQARGVMPAEAFSLLEDQLVGIAESRAQSAFTVGAVVSLLLALWGVSGAFRSMMEAMNVMYEIEEARPFWKVYGMSIFLSLGIAALLLAALALVVFGPEIGGAIADVVGLGYVFEVVWNIVKWPVLIAVVLFAFALDPDRGVLVRAAAGLYWVAVLFSALLAVQRSQAVEVGEGTRDALRLSGLEPAGVFLGKAGAIVVQLLALELLLALGVGVLYDTALGAPMPLVATTVVATLGVAAAGSLYGVLAAGLRIGATLLPLLLLPVVAPVLIAATQAFIAAAGDDPGAAWRWFGLLAVFALMYITFGIFAFESLLEES